MTVQEVLLERFDGDAETVRRYCRDQARHYTEVAREFPKFKALARAYRRIADAGRGTNGVPEMQEKKRRSRETG